MVTMVYPREQCLDQLEFDFPSMTKGSLCSGVGGLDMALPGRLVWVAEKDENASRVLKREHPEVPNLEDITAEDFPGTHVDLLTSGDPCQSMSAAGRQKASEDERFLWPHVRTIIDRIRPKQLFLENVRNITSVALVKGADDWRGEKGSVLAMRLNDLRSMGYYCRWTVLGACALGACHHRHRWFLRAWHVGNVDRDPEVIVNGCGAPRGGGRRVLLPSPTTADGSGGPGRSPMRTGGDNLRTAVTLLPTPRATDIGTEGRRSSEGWRPQLGQVIHALLPTPRATDGVNGGPNQRGRKGDLAMGSAVQAEHWGKFAPAVAMHADIFGTLPPEPTVPAPKGGRRLNPELSEWMMGYRRGYLTEDLARNDALRCAGNGVVPLQARAAWELLE